MSPKESSNLNSLLKEYVTETHGTKVWTTVSKRVGLSKGFDKETKFDIALTDKVVAAVVELTDVSKVSFLEGFGEYNFRLLSQRENLVLRNVARDWLGFLQNLDYLQWITADQILGPVAKTFRCEPGVTQNQVLLHCYSVHPGFYPMLKGTLIAAIRDLYSKDPDFELKSVRQEAVGQLEDQVREQAVFLISIKGARQKPDLIPPTFTCQTRKYAERQIHAEDVSSHKNPKTQRIERSQVIAGLWLKKSEPVISKHMDTLPVTPFTFVHILPYHVIFNSSMEILQTGIYLQRQLPGSTRGQPLLSAFFELVNPPLADLSYVNIQRFINSPFLLKVKHNVTVKGQKIGSSLLLKGQMILLQDSGLVLYMCSPLVRSFQEIESCNVTLYDIPLHDPTRDALFQKNFHSVANAYSSQEQPFPDPIILQIRTQHTDEKEKSIETKDAGFTTVLLPKTMKIATGKEQLPKPAYNSNVTVLFCDIVNFATMTKTCSPASIVEMINELYCQFDEATDLHDTYRVESIGDAYLVLCGAPQSVPDHVSRIAHTSMAMLTGSKKVRSPNKTGTFVSVRIGVHTGGLLWGVIGKQIPRFVVMGGTVMMASRMESHGLPDKVHVTQEVYDCLRNTTFDFEERGFVEIKGMGVMKTYFLLGNRK